MTNNENWWHYDQLESGLPYNWHPAASGDNPDDNIDYHLDLGSGRLPKGRLSLDRHGSPDITIDLDTLELIDSKGPLTEVENSLPFPNNSIESIISHHCLEHIGDGFLHLMDEIYRVLKPGAKLRIIVPMFPCLAAVSDPDHKRYFTFTTFESFTGRENQDFWSDSFAEPYTKCRYELIDKDIREREDLGDFHPENPKEIRVTLRK